MSKLSFSTCYYLRKILLQHKEEIKSILAQKAGFCFISQEILARLLHGIYLEETLEQLLQTLYADVAEISAKVQQLEALSAQHQQISLERPFDYVELAEIKRQVFLILGFKRVIVKIEDLVTALNQITEHAISYLGAILTFNAWQSTRPQFDWLNNFQINRSTKKMTFSGAITETAEPEQLQWIQDWVTAFIFQISQTIRGFDNLLEQQKIGELPGGVLVSQVDSYSAWVKLPGELSTPGSKM